MPSPAESAALVAAARRIAYACPGELSFGEPAIRSYENSEQYKSPFVRRGWTGVQVASIGEYTEGDPPEAERARSHAEPSSPLAAPWRPRPPG